MSDKNKHLKCNMTKTKTTIIILFALSIVLFMLNISSAGGDDLNLQNETIQSGQFKYFTARGSITAGNSFTVESGSDVTIRSGSGGILLTPGFHAKKGCNLALQVWNNDPAQPDLSAPTVISSFPGDGQLVAGQGNPLEMLMTFGDTDSGVHSVKLFDENGVDITTQTTIGGPYNSQTISLTINNSEVRDYQFSLELEDLAGNTGTTQLSFTFDNVIPVTTVNVSKGVFSEPFTVDLTCDDPNATIYYTTDGYPPFEGAANTVSGTGSINGIPINQSMNFQYIAIDVAGNIEQTNSEIYIIGDLQESPTMVSSIFNTVEKRVELAWGDAAGQISGYHIYRCLSPFDLYLLNRSHNEGYPPPVSLRVSDSVSASTYFNDLQIVSGVTYHYGVTAVDVNGVEGPVSVITPVFIDGETYEDNNPVAKALAWLASTQDEQGYWGEKESLRLLATSQVLNAYKALGQTYTGTHNALFYLRGHFADNNDYLARKILALSDYGQNVDQMVNRLIAQSHIAGTKILGWGVTTRLTKDAVSTALGAMAVGRNTRNLSLNNNAYLLLKDYPDLESSVTDRFSWIPGHNPDLFVSGLVYYTVNNHYQVSVFDSTWISNNQNTDGSFGNGLVDTCAVVMWTNNLDQGIRDDAEDYIISRQSDNGSWNDNTYLTGLALAALHSTSTDYSDDTSGFPDPLELTNLTDGQVIDSNNVIVSGTMNTYFHSVEVNGIPSILSGDIFTITLPIALGNNQIVVRGKSEKGTTVYEKTISVTRYPSNYIFVGPNGDDENDGIGPGLDALRTISAAVTKAVNGDVIKIESGSYNEVLIQITKNISLIGESTSNKPVIFPASNTGNQIEIGPNGRGWFQVHGSATVEFENIVLDGTGKNVYSAVYFHNDNSGGTFKNCMFRNIRHSQYKGNGIRNYGGIVNVLDTTMQNIRKEGCASFNNSQMIINNFHYTGKGSGDHLDYGIQVSGNSRVDVRNSTLTGCLGTVPGPPGTGIVYGSGAILIGTSGNVFINNTITNSERCIWYVNGITDADNTVSGNNFNCTY